MGIITNRECFAGFYHISQTCFDKLDNYIERFEKCFLQDLLGCDLAELFIADLDADGVPQTQRFLDIYNEVCIDISKSSISIDCNRKCKSAGMKDMMTALLYFMYNRDHYIMNTSVGKTINDSEVSQNVLGGLLASDNYERWNKGIDSWKCIQYFICKNRSVYPEFNGEDNDYMFFGGNI